MFWLHRLNPANKFGEYFDLVQATSPELKHEVYRLRHRVFCEEMGFWRPTFDEQESDEYDERSRHLLLRSAKSGASVGSVRLVMVPSDRPWLQLPVEKICASTINRKDIDPAELPRGSIAEVSRLCLAREFRRKRRVVATGHAAQRSFGSPEHPTYPYVQLGLYLGAIALAEQLRLTTLFMLTEHWLLTHFRRIGFPIRQIGGPVDYRGMCVPSMGKIANPIADLPFFMRALYTVITHQIVDPRHVPGHHHPVPRPARLNAHVASAPGGLPSLSRRAASVHRGSPFAGSPLESASRRLP